MTTILFVTTSPNGPDAYSSAVGQMLLDRLTIRHPGARIIVRDLVSDAVPHIDPRYIAARYLSVAERSAEQAQGVATSDTLIAELKAADHVIIASSMINFTISSQLKAWIDQIVRRGHTYVMEGERPVSILSSKKVYLVLARGAIYREPPMDAMDFQEPYLRCVLPMYGLSDLTVIRVEGMRMGPEIAEAALAAARGQIEEIVPL